MLKVWLMSIVLYPKNVKKLKQIEEGLILGTEVKIHPGDLAKYIVLPEPLEIKGYLISDKESLTSTFANLPPSLIKTLKGLIELGGHATAHEVATWTKRTTARESDYLNELYRLQVLEKNRKGHRVYYTPAANYELRQLKELLMV